MGSRVDDGLGWGAFALASGCVWRVVHFWGCEGSKAWWGRLSFEMRVVKVKMLG